MNIADNLKKVKDSIAEAAVRSRRKPEDIKIVAVSKTHPPAKIMEAFEAGQRIFGENKVQEALAKIPVLPSEIEWHLVGHLQTNKSKQAVAHFNVIQSVDSIKIAEKLDKYCSEAGNKLDVLIQLDLAGEETKFGVNENDFYNLCDFLNRADRLNLIGLMCLPPLFNDPERTRPYFTKIREHLEKYNSRYMKKIKELSMGMSNDYSVAIEEGATIVRIGTAIFGERI